MPQTLDLKPWQLDIWEIRAIDRKLCGGIVVLPAEPVGEPGWFNPCPLWECRLVSPQTIVVAHRLAAVARVVTGHTNFNREAKHND